MIDIKTKEEIEAMRQGGKILAEVLSEVIKKVGEGISENELDKLADELIIKKGAEPAFKKVKGYKNATCISTNSTVVHGIPSDYVLKKGDVIGIDCGAYYKGFYTDMSESVVVGADSKKDKEKQEFLKTGKKALEEAIAEAKIGNRIGHISKKIQDIIEGEGYSVVRNLIGHGVGRELHEDPEVPGFLDKDIKDTPKLKEGMTIAIEAIYNMGAPDVSYASSDGWTIVTKDQSLSGLFERTVAITENGPSILTK